MTQTAGTTSAGDTSSVATGQARAGLWLPTVSLWRREMVRFFRQRNRVVGALATPVVFWLVLGGGLNRSFTLHLPEAAQSVGYLEYFFPGTVVLILLFTAIFSTISVIEDRREGFLQGVLVAPIPRLAIVLGKVLGGASIATIQGLIFLVAWPLVVGWPDTAAATAWLAASIPIMFVLSAGLTALGLCIAWPMDSTAGFHAVMNLFLMPMWFLSGAVFPVDKAPPVMRAIMWCNPLTYGQTSFSAALAGGRAYVGAPVPAGVAIAITLVCAIAIVFTAARFVGTPRKDGRP